MRVTLADTTVDVYEQYATKQGRPVDQVIEAQLNRFKRLEPGTKAVVVNAEMLESLSVALGGLPIKDAADLCAKVEELAAVSFQHIRLDFSPKHLAQLADRAERQGKPVEQVIQDVVKTMAEQFFWHSGGGEAVLVRPAPPVETPAASA